jgi:hypothetical protein
MPLRFDPPADPLTPTSEAQSYVIESDALQRLTKEIERYGRRELAGRSILIAGHRGIGKTTLVRKAIENARNRSAYGGRPLFVDLHGPDLLAPPDKDATAKAENRGSGKTANSKDGKAENQVPGKDEEKNATNTGAGAEKTPPTADPQGATAPGTSNQVGAQAGSGANDSTQPSGADLQSFVERLTFSLYRAAAKEFVEKFREGMRFEDQKWNRLDELAEQFALELDGSTDLTRIRLLYERAGALKSGVLNSARGVTGSQELALLAASSQAYRIISGKLDENETKEDEGTNKSKWSLASDNLISPITGILTGSLAWTALPGTMDPLAKMFTSFTAGLASAIAIKFTRTIERESKRSSKVVFVPERNELALRRLLPVLVDRFCDIGIPPIFVVDELDKVQNISERMEALMGFLKQFVTERAFFCFLVDREYYERLENTVSTAAFPKEATLFGDRLFVQYTPEAAHEYLRNVTKAGLPPRVSETADDIARDLDVLPYVLLRRSYMHPFDLRREISRATNAQNEFRFPPRALFNVQQYRNEVYYQVAVECVLAEEKLRDFAEDPNRAQLLYDTLYFPIRTKKLLTEFDASRETLKKHLAGRMGQENGKLLSEEDLQILHDALLELVQFLCDPRALLDTMQTLAVAKYLPEPKIFPPAVVQIIEAAAGPKLTTTAPPVQEGPNDGTNNGPSSGGGGISGHLSHPPSPAEGSKEVAASSSGPEQSGGSVPTKASPLLELDPASKKYEWQFDKYGYPVKRPSAKGFIAQMQGLAMGTSTAKATLSVVPEVKNLLDDFEAAVQLLGTKQGTTIDIELWEKMRLIPTPPTWSYLKEAAEALRNAPSLPETKKEEYVNALITYRSNLQSSLQTILLAVAIAVSMASNKRRGTELSERAALEILGEALAEAPSREPMLNQLGNIAEDVGKIFPLPLDVFQKTASYRGMLEAIERGAKATQILDFTPADVNLQAGVFYEKWFIQFYEGRRPKIDSLWPLLALAMGSLPFGITRVNPLRMTLLEWSQGYVENQSRRQEILRLERLGFRRQADTMLKESPVTKEDPLLRAIEASIRNRGYEKASAILWAAKQTLTWDWLPSESIGCRIRRSAPLRGSDTTYVFIELDGPLAPEGPEIEELRKNKTVKVAFFGSVDAPVNTLLSFRYFANPQSLDDLVARVENATT